MSEEAIETSSPGDSRYYDLLFTLAQLHADKSSDYGLRTDEWAQVEINDPLFNFRGAELWGVAPWCGAMIRAQDKMSRLQTLAAGSELTNETARDSFLDLASYALIACILFEEEQDNGDDDDDDIDDD